jgi:hypothetical protein
VLEWRVDSGAWQVLEVLDGWTFERELENVADGHSYDFRIWAVQYEGGTVLQTSAPAVLGEPHVYPHEAPGDVNVTVTSPTTAVVTWTDWSDSETGYRVERAVEGTATWSSLGTTAPNITTFTDSTLQASTSYHYRVTTLGTGVQSSTQTGASAQSSQSNEARPNPGLTAYNQ